MSDLREADDIASEARAGEARYSMAQDTILASRENEPNYDEEMENAEDPCCDECAYWDAYALKQGISRGQMDTIRATQIGNLSTDCRVYKAIAEESSQSLMRQCGICPDCKQLLDSDAHFGQECVNI